MRPLPSRGFSLIELLLTLGVVAVLLLASFLVYREVSGRMRVNSELETIQIVAANFQKLYRFGRVPLLTHQIVSNAKVVPKAWVVTNTYAYGNYTFHNRRGNTLYFSSRAAPPAPTAYNGPACSSTIPCTTVTIQYNNEGASQRECVLMATGLASLQKSGHIAAYRVPGISIIPGDSPAAIGTVCRINPGAYFMIYIRH